MRDTPRVVAHINIHNYYLLRRDSALLSRLKRDAFLIFEGIGMKTAGWVSGIGWRPDLNGTDMLPSVLEQAAGLRLPIYFLGAQSDVVAEAAKRSCARYPGLNLVGFRGGYFPRTEDASVADAIRQSAARLVLVGRGFPLQERFALDQRHRLGASLVWNVGGLFDFLAGAKPRAPQWMRRVRLEWMYRLGLEPREMWSRSAISAPRIIGQATRTRFLKFMGKHAS